MTNKVDFYKLPLGAWFKYPASNRVYVKLDSNKVAVISNTYDDRTQEVYSAFSPDDKDRSVEWEKFVNPTHCKYNKQVSTEEHVLKLTQAELDYCYEHSHGNTPYMKAKAYGRMIEVIVQRKYDKLNNVVKCPMCDSEDYIQIDHEGDMLAPEATYFVCNDCGYVSEPE